MKIKIRKADEKDIAGLNLLLYQVHGVHVNGRPDIFKKGEKKFSDIELKEVLKDDKTPIFVATDENDNILGHCFCVFREVKNDKSLCDRKVWYIDDLCVDKNIRNSGIGKKLYEYVLNFAKENNFTSVTLDVWNFNESAFKFYEKIGFLPLKTLMEKQI